MTKRAFEESANEQRSSKKGCARFREEWLREFVQADMPEVPDSVSKQRTLLGDIFMYNRDNGEVICTLCKRANAQCEWVFGKKWSEWKLDYLKRHLGHKVHITSVATLRQQQRRGGIRMLFSETSAEKEKRIELVERKTAGADEVKILIDNVLLAVKLNSSMLSVQAIHDHVEKYTKLPGSWRSKNYAFEFLECINSVIKEELFEDWRRSSFHTLIVDESTDISVSKMLILYVKFRKAEDMCYCSMFAGIVRLTECSSLAIVTAITTFYKENNIDLNKMVMFTSDGASVMLGKNNGVAAVLRRTIPHLLEQHCVAHREDLGIDDAWKHVSLMKDIETLLRTVYTIFCRSSVRKSKFEELCKVAEHESISFRPLNEVRWLSRDFAVRALLRNYEMLTQYCREQVEEDNDPIHKYCFEKLSKPEYHVAISILNEVLGALAELCRLLQRSNLTPVEAFQLTKVKIMKLRSQYLGENSHFSKEVESLLSSYQSPVDTTAVVRFIERVCNHLSNRFPDDELREWTVFDKDAFAAAENLKNFSFGTEKLKNLATRYSILLNKPEGMLKKNLIDQYVDFKLIISEKLATGALNNFDDMIAYARNQEQLTDLAELLDICGTFQASSADCERGFSLMNKIKTTSRNRLEVDHLDNLMRIKLFLQSGKTVNLDRVYQFWKSGKGRRTATTAICYMMTDWTGVDFKMCKPVYLQRV